MYLVLLRNDFQHYFPIQGSFILRHASDRCEHQLRNPYCEIDMYKKCILCTKNVFFALYLIVNTLVENQERVLNEYSRFVVPLDRVYNT